MGLSIHYSGSFNEEISLQAMIEEIKTLLKFIDGDTLFLK